jgi:predicted dehydrogenase
MSRTLKVAVAGAGYFSQFHYDAWRRLSNVQLVANCDQELARARSAAASVEIEKSFGSLDALLDEIKPDLLDIVTPPPTHLAFIRKAAERGVHVICQKPFCGSLQDATQAVKIAHDAAIVVVVHENFRFQPWYVKLKTLIESGDLGSIYQIAFRLRPGDGQGPKAYLERQPYFQEMPRFLVHETAVHFIDTFRFLCGEIDSVFADLRRLNPVISGEDAGTILFRFKSGAVGLFDGNRLVDHQAKNQRLTMGELLLEAERATISLDGDGDLCRREPGSEKREPISFDWQNQGFGGDCVYHLQSHVIDHFLSGAALQNEASEYLTNIHVEQAIYEANERGTWVDTSQV